MFIFSFFYLFSLLKKQGAFQRENYGFFDGFNRQKKYFRRLTKRLKNRSYKFSMLFFDAFYSGCYIYFSTLFTVGKRFSALNPYYNFTFLDALKRGKCWIFSTLFICGNAEFFRRFFIWIVLNILDAFIRLNENKPFKALDI